MPDSSRPSLPRKQVSSFRLKDDFSQKLLCVLLRLKRDFEVDRSKEAVRVSTKKIFDKLY